jgi:hypothetical protein
MMVNLPFKAEDEMLDKSEAREVAKNEEDKDVTPEGQVGTGPQDKLDDEQKGEQEQQNGEEGYDDADYMPDFIEAVLENPPILPHESKDDFVELFESFEMDYWQRPKTDVEYTWTLQATIARWELLRYERMKVAIIAVQQRSAVEALHRQAYGFKPASKKERHDLRNSAREGSMRFYSEPDYKEEFTKTLERIGFGRHAAEAASFLRALPSLAVVDRLINSTQKRLNNALKNLDAAYATRDREDPMPRSSAALRSDEIRNRRAEATREARKNGNPKANSGQ